MSAAPAIADIYGFWMIGVKKFAICSKSAIKTVVNVEPTNVLTAIVRPRTTNARIMRVTFIAERMIPGENGKKALSMTEMPLVPPSRSESGNINNTVERA